MAISEWRQRDYSEHRSKRQRMNKGIAVRIHLKAICEIKVRPTKDWIWDPVGTCNFAAAAGCHRHTVQMYTNIYYTECYCAEVEALDRGVWAPCQRSTKLSQQQPTR